MIRKPVVNTKKSHNVKRESKNRFISCNQLKFESLYSRDTIRMRIKEAEFFGHSSNKKAVTH